MVGPRPGPTASISGYASYFRPVDSFGHMGTALRRLPEVAAPNHMDPASPEVFHFPLVTFAGDDADAVRDAPQI
jgi:hypothetical protein